MLGLLKGELEPPVLIYNIGIMVCITKSSLGPFLRKSCYL